MKMRDVRPLIVGAIAGAALLACNARGTGGAAATTGTAGTTGNAEPAEGAAAIPPGSLAEQAIWTKLNEEMDAHIKSLNGYCGTTIKGTYDIPSYKGKFKDGESYGVSGYARSSCESLIEALADLCRNSEPGKLRVKSKIHVVTCQYGSVGQKPKISLKGDTWIGQFDPDAGGATMSSAAAEWLQKSL